MYTSPTNGYVLQPPRQPRRRAPGKRSSNPGYRDIGRTAIRLKRRLGTLAASWPYLSRIFKRRHRAGPGIISLCNCRVNVPSGEYKGQPRSDSKAYHELVKWAWGSTRERPNSNIREFCEKMCTFLSDRFDLYATLGIGSMMPILPSCCPPYAQASSRLMLDLSRFRLGAGGPWASGIPRSRSEIRTQA
jgi:hypothetical protein